MFAHSAVKHLFVTESMTYRSGSVQVWYSKMGAWSGIVVAQKERALKGSFDVEYICIIHHRPER